MADKMMRIAGRGADGKAKAIQTDNNGVLRVGNETFLDSTNLGFEGKIKGDTSRVMSYAGTIVNSNTSLQLTEPIEVSNYNILNTISTSGLYAMALFKFNVLGQAKLDRTVPLDTTVEEYRKKIESMLFGFTGHGTSASSNGLTVKVHAYNSSGASAWKELKVTTNPTDETFEVTIPKEFDVFGMVPTIDKDGFVNILVHANGPGDGTTLSRVSVKDSSLTLLDEKKYISVRDISDSGTTYVDTLGNKTKELSVEQDPAGLSVLRVIDAAPHAFDNLTGSYKTVEEVSVKVHDENRVTSVAKGTKDIVKITPPLNVICTIKAIGFNVAAPTGATSGSTDFYISIGEENPSHFKKPINKNSSYTSGNSIFLNDNTMQQSIRGLQFSESKPLYLVFANNTDVAVTNTRSFYVIYEERVVR